MATTVFILIAYLIGSLSFAVIVSCAFGLPDPHSYGSGNPGATNVLRTGRKSAALLTLLGDGAKGWVAVYFARQLASQYGVDETGIAGVALAVFIGHLFPVFFGFRGGKGVATCAGFLLVLYPWFVLALGIVFAAIARFGRKASIGSLSLWSSPGPSVARNPSGRAGSPLLRVMVR